MAMITGVFPSPEIREDYRKLLEELYKNPKEGKVKQPKKKSRRRKHWTQTREGKRHMAELARKRVESRRQEEKNGSNKKETSLKEHAAYIFGRVEVEIEHYSRRNSVPFAALASRVAELLRHP